MECIINTDDTLIKSVIYKINNKYYDGLTMKLIENYENGKYVYKFFLNPKFKPIYNPIIHLSKQTCYLYLIDKKGITCFVKNINNNFNPHSSGDIFFGLFQESQYPGIGYENKIVPFNVIQYPTDTIQPFKMNLDYMPLYVTFDEINPINIQMNENISKQIYLISPFPSKEFKIYKFKNWLIAVNFFESNYYQIYILNRDLPIKKETKCLVYNCSNIKNDILLAHLDYDVLDSIPDFIYQNLDYNLPNIIPIAFDIAMNCYYSIYDKWYNDKAEVVDNPNIYFSHKRCVYPYGSEKIALKYINKDFENKKYIYQIIYENEDGQEIICDQFKTKVKLSRKKIYIAQPYIDTQYNLKFYYKTKNKQIDYSFLCNLTFNINDYEKYITGNCIQYFKPTNIEIPCNWLDNNLDIYDISPLFYSYWVKYKQLNLFHNLQYEEFPFFIVPIDLDIDDIYVKWEILSYIPYNFLLKKYKGNDFDSNNLTGKNAFKYILSRFRPVKENVYPTKDEIDDVIFETITEEININIFKIEFLINSFIFYAKKYGCNFIVLPKNDFHYIEGLRFEKILSGPHIDDFNTHVAKYDTNNNFTVTMIPINFNTIDNTWILDIQKCSIALQKYWKNLFKTMNERKLFYEKIKTFNWLLMPKNFEWYTMDNWFDFTLSIIPFKSF